MTIPNPLLIHFLTTDEVKGKYYHAYSSSKLPKLNTMGLDPEYHKLSEAQSTGLFWLPSLTAAQFIPEHYADGSLLGMFTDTVEGEWRIFSIGLLSPSDRNPKYITVKTYWQKLITFNAQY